MLHPASRKHLSEAIELRYTPPRLWRVRYVGEPSTSVASFRRRGRTMLSRRALIGKAAVGAAAALALGAARTGLASTCARPAAPDDPAGAREGPADDRDGQKNTPPPADS